MTSGHEAHEWIDEPRLRAFLNDLVALGPASSNESSPLPKSATLALLIQGLHHRLAKARDGGFALNPWTVAGIGTNEVRNCAVLAALMDSEQLGATARRFLAAMLEQVPRASTRSFPMADILTGNYIVRCETCVAGDWSNRVDILIESPSPRNGWIIALEAKINAGLGSGQLEDYHADLGRRAEMTGRRAFLIFLSPFEPVGIDTRVRQDVDHIRWADIRRAADMAVADCTPDEAHARYLLSAFRDHVVDFD